MRIVIRPQAISNVVDFNKWPVICIGLCECQCVLLSSCSLPLGVVVGGGGGQVSIPLYGLNKTGYTIFSFLNTVSFQTRSPKRVNFMSGLQYFGGTSCPSSGDLMKKWKAVTSHRQTKSPFVDSCSTSLQRPPRYNGHFLLSPLWPL